MVGDAQATQRRLLEAAAQEFAARGIAGARVDRIAEAARSNKAQIYHYFGSKDELFDAVFNSLVADTLHEVGKQSGMDAESVDACVKDQAGLDKLSADKKFAFETLKVDVTPTFFVNGEMIKGAMSFEELDATLKPLLKR